MRGTQEQIFTIGYQDRTPTEFVRDLLAKRITRIVDVRELPLSRRRGFSKTALRTALEAAGIEYVHLREAGNPHRHLRHDLAKCLAAYRGHLDNEPHVVELVAEAVTGQRTALLCVERDATACHRSILGERVGRRAGMIIVDL